MENKNISVIIPTLNAGLEIEHLLQVLLKQNKKVDEIIIIDSSSDDDTQNICKKYDEVKLLIIDRQKFDHGETRAIALNKAIGEFILFLTQDAVPSDERYISNLLLPFQDDKVAMVSGRQCAKNDATEIEKLTREFNYPEISNVRTEADVPRLGIKTFFASDVCSAYRRSAYEDIGGFDYPIITNEDLVIASKFIYAGYKVAYAADAKVIHSHDYNLKQQFMRNFDIGVCLKVYENNFKNLNVSGEGIKMVKWVISELLKNGNLFSSIYYFFECACKLSGNKLGKNFQKLPYEVVKTFSPNKQYWDRL